MYSTISSKHAIKPIVGSGLSGSIDHTFLWMALEPEASYEGAFMSSPGIRDDSVIRRTVGAMYREGHLDCGYATLRDTKWMRPP